MNAGPGAPHPVQRIVVVGTGAMASLVGARLADSGRCDVTLVGTWQAALDTIAASVITCIYDIEIDDEDVDYDEVNFFFTVNGTEEVVPYDEDCNAATGWHWVGTDHAQIEFCDAACDQLQGGDVTAIRGEFGCEQIIID